MKRNLGIVIAVVVLALTALVPSAAFAYDPLGDACVGNSAAQNSSLCQGRPANPSNNPLTGPTGLIRGIANIVAIGAGIAAVIIIIVAGLKYVTSGGDAAKAKSAKETIVSAVIGLIVIAVAAELVGFVISRV